MVTSKKNIEKIVIAIILLINILYLSWRPFQDFNFFDYGSFFDASWRVSVGLVPYRDFIFNTGPVYLFVNAFFFWLFGFTKAAFTINMAVFSTIAALVIYRACRPNIPTFPVLAIMLLSTVAFYWPMAQPWYDQTAYFWSIIGFAVVMRNIPLQNQKHAFLSGLFCGAMAGLSFMSKTNIGAFTGLSLGLTFLAFPYRWRSVSGMAIGTAFVFGVIFLFVPASDYVNQTLIQYGVDRSDRLLRLVYPPNWFNNFYWISFFLIAVNTCFSRKEWQRTILFFVTLVTALFSFLTGSIWERQHYPMMGVVLAQAFVILYLSLKSPVSLRHKRFVQISIPILIIVTLGLAILSSEYGVNRRWGKGSDLYSIGDYKIKAFGGWKCGTDKGEAVDGLHDFIIDNILESDSILNLTDMQIIFPLTGRKGFVGLPFIWHVGHMPRPGKQLLHIRNKILSSPPDWIIINTKPELNIFSTEMLIKYLRIPESFRNRYDAVRFWNQYALLKKR